MMERGYTICPSHFMGHEKFKEHLILYKIKEYQNSFPKCVTFGTSQRSVTYFKNALKVNISIISYGEL